MLSSVRLDVTGHRWVVQLATCKFHVYYHLGKLNLEADALSWIEWDCIFELEAVKVVLSTAVKGPVALTEVYACGIKAYTDLTAQDKEPSKMAAED